MIFCFFGAGVAPERTTLTSFAPAPPPAPVRGWTGLSGATPATKDTRSSVSISGFLAPGYSCPALAKAFWEKNITMARRMKRPMEPARKAKSPILRSTNI